MAKITISLSDEAKALAEKHAVELGYEDAADWAFELLRNYAAQREDGLYRRMHIGEHNEVFGRSRREQADADHRAHLAEQEEALREQEERDRQAKADATKK